MGGEPADLVVRRASAADAEALAELLHDFNSEFGDPSPAPEVLARRLQRLFGGEGTLALLAGHPPVGFALATLRPNVWYDTPVALLDELYVVPTLRGRTIGTRLLQSLCALLGEKGVEHMEVNVDGEDYDARRFYERHGFSCIHGTEKEPELYYSRGLP